MATATIPRFLLPQRGLIWQARTFTISTSVRSARHASSKAVPKSSKPRVLEKPDKFNPPSHGAKLRKEAKRYPGPPLSAQELAAQKTKQYPNMMPPEGSFMHWFITNRSIHIYITLVSRVYWGVWMLRDVANVYAGHAVFPRRLYLCQ